MVAPVTWAVLDAIRTAVVVVGHDGRLLHANPPGRRALGGALARGAIDIQKLLAAQDGAAVELTVVRVRRNGAAEVVRAGPPGAPSTLAAREREAILERLKATGWKLAETARQLGISRTTLWRRLRAYGLERGERTE